ncbi:MAG: alpha/beta fold hydrolase [Actinomycetales bacterium]|nr:alpha/beta fold hydrolase [Actinomycetales bacterium]
MSITAGHLATDRLTFATRSAGQGELLLLLHGITAGAVVWDPVLTALARHFRVVAVDQRGHGGTDAPAHGYGAEEYVADVGALLDVLGPARAVVGHSLGARNAILAGAAFPGRVGAVVAVDYAAGIEPEVFERLRASRRGGEGALASEDDVRSAIRARSPLLPDDAVERRLAHLYSIADGGFLPRSSPSAIDQTLDAIDVDLEPALRASTVPTLIVRGAQSPFLSAQAYRSSLALRAGIEGAVVPGTDHFVPEEAPDALTRLIRTFLSR